MNYETDYTHEPGPSPPGLPPRPPISRISGKALASFVFGVMGMIFWIFAGLPAIILALLAKADIRKAPGAVHGKIFANLGLVLGLLSFVVPFFLISALWNAAVRPNSYAIADSSQRIVHLHLSGPISEVPYQDAFDFSGNEIASLKSLVERIHEAAEDETVEALLLTVEQPMLGLAQIEELWTAIQTFKETDKKVYAHSESLDTYTFFLLASASHLNLVPTSSFWLTGLYSEGLYLKDALESLHLEADIVHIGEYKSAGEMLTRTGPSEPARANMNALLDGLYANGVNLIAQARDLEPEEVRTLIDEGPYTLDRAIEVGLLDSSMHIDEFIDFVKDQYDDDIVVDNYYGVDQSETGTSGFAQLISLMSGATGTKDYWEDDAIGVIYIEGTIVPGYRESGPFGSESGAFSGNLRKTLDRAAKDESIKAVVIRVNSPGGSAVASEIILRAAEQLNEEKPVIVSMGNTAASGGYYVACGADTIFADASTVTGSIGVLGGKLVTTSMWNEWGVHWFPYERGTNADIFSSAQPFDEVQRAKIVESMGHVYEVFKQHVVDGRGTKLTKPIDELAAGRVFTGAQAKEVGLVDEIGGLYDAIVFAAAQVDLEDYEIRILPEPSTFMEQLMIGFSGQGERPTDLDANNAARPRTWTRLLPLGPNESLPPGAAMAASLDPSRTRSLTHALTAMSLLTQERVITMMPEWIAVR